MCVLVRACVCVCVCVCVCICVYDKSQDVSDVASAVSVYAANFLLLCCDL